MQANINKGYGAILFGYYTKGIAHYMINLERFI